jgi:hypothetical protein
MHKMITTNFKHSLQIALHIFLYNITVVKKCFSSSTKGPFIFPSINLLYEVVRKLFGNSGKRLYRENDKWLDEDDKV